MNNENPNFILRGLKYVKYLLQIKFKYVHRKYKIKFKTGATNPVRLASRLFTLS